MRRILRWLVPGALALAVGTACSDAFGVEDILGTWETTSVNGYSVPGTVVLEGSSFDIQYYRWTFVDGGHCSATGQVDGEVHSGDCDYTVNLEQRTITISFEVNSLQGSIDGNTMTLTDEGDIVWILRGQ